MAENNTALPPYQRIAAKIRTQIQRGDLRPGDFIPSIRQITESENVSTATATRVAAVLRADGYAESIPGIGTVVAPPRQLTTGPDRLSMLRAGGTGYNTKEHSRILDAQVVPAPPTVATALALRDGEDVIQRQRIYEDDQGVVALSTSWLPGDLASSAPELLSTEPLPKMTFGLVEERTGRRASRRRDVITVEATPADIAPTLNVEPGTTVLVMTNCYWDQDGQPTEYAIDYLGAGRQLSAEYDISQ